MQSHGARGTRGGECYTSGMLAEREVWPERIRPLRRIDYAHAHPQTALLVIEVADSSLRKDRGVKAALYATAGIPELWLVNLTDLTVEVHRQPTAGRYADVERIDTSGTISPAEFPSVRISVGELLT
jgi:Uma2 family endonuclease